MRMPGDDLVDVDDAGSDGVEAGLGLGSLLIGLRGPLRKLARTEVAGLIVSTMLTPDCGWETAVIDAQGAHPVARYADEQSAEQGHAAWVAKTPTLEVLTKLGYGDMVPDRVIVLQRPVRPPLVDPHEPGPRWGRAVVIAVGLVVVALLWTWWR